jgi:hypothetical protein
MRERLPADQPQSCILDRLGVVQSEVCLFFDAGPVTGENLAGLNRKPTDSPLRHSHNAI